MMGDASSEVRFLGALPPQLYSSLSSISGKDAIKFTVKLQSVYGSHLGNTNVCSHNPHTSSQNVVYELTFTDDSRNRKWIALADKWTRKFSQKHQLSRESLSSIDKKSVLFHSLYSTPTVTWLVVRKQSWKEFQLNSKEEKGGLTSSCNPFKKTFPDGMNVKCSSPPLIHTHIESENGRQQSVDSIQNHEQNNNADEFLGEQYHAFWLDALHYLAPKPRTAAEVLEWFNAKQMKDSKMLEVEQVGSRRIPQGKTSIPPKVLENLLRRWTTTETISQDSKDAGKREFNRSQIFYPSDGVDVQYNLVSEGFLHIDIESYGTNDIDLKQQVADRGVKALSHLNGTEPLIEKLLPYLKGNILLGNEDVMMSSFGAIKGSLCELPHKHVERSTSLKVPLKRQRENEIREKKGMRDVDKQGNICSSQDSLSSLVREDVLFTAMDECPVEWDHGNLEKLWNSVGYHYHPITEKGVRKKKSDDIYRCTKGVVEDFSSCPISPSLGNNFSQSSFCAGYDGPKTSMLVTTRDEKWKYFDIPTLSLHSSHQYLRDAVEDSQSLARDYLQCRHALLAHEEVTAKAAAWRQTCKNPGQCSRCFDAQVNVWWNKQEIPRVAFEQHLSRLHDKLYHLERNVAENVFLNSLITE